MMILHSSNFQESSTVGLYEELRLKIWIKSTFPHVVIDEVEKLNNKYLYAAFMLKKCEKDYQVMELIHSTAAENVRSIEKGNLDWRLVQRAKYGYGVSFSKNADYANYHSSWSGGSRRAYVVCDVLVSSIQTTNECRTTPSGNNDTLRSTNGHVFVKFDDFTFYPKYALYYDKPVRTCSSFYRRRR